MGNLFLPSPVPPRAGMLSLSQISKKNLKKKIGRGEVYSPSLKMKRIAVAERQARIPFPYFTLSGIFILSWQLVNSCPCFHNGGARPKACVCLRDNTC